MSPADKTFVDVAALDEFRSTLSARLSEAQSIVAYLTERLKEPPALGGLDDAGYVRDRYLSLYAQHVDRAGRLVNAIAAAQTAMTTMIDNYQTVESQITADATEIGNLLDGVSGALVGDRTDAG
jgi:hypothetical protein